MVLQLAGVRDSARIAVGLKAKGGRRVSLLLSPRFAALRRTALHVQVPLATAPSSQVGFRVLVVDCAALAGEAVAVDTVRLSGGQQVRAVAASASRADAAALAASASGSPVRLTGTAAASGAPLSPPVSSPLHRPTRGDLDSVALPPRATAAVVVVPAESESEPGAEGCAAAAGEARPGAVTERAATQAAPAASPSLRRRAVLGSPAPTRSRIRGGMAPRRAAAPAAAAQPSPVARPSRIPTLRSPPHQQPRRSPPRAVDAASPPGVAPPRGSAPRASAASAAQPAVRPRRTPRRALAPHSPARTAMRAPSPRADPSAARPSPPRAASHRPIPASPPAAPAHALPAGASPPPSAGSPARSTPARRKTVPRTGPSAGLWAREADSSPLRDLISRMELAMDEDDNNGDGGVRSDDGTRRAVVGVDVAAPPRGRAPGLPPPADRASAGDGSPGRPSPSQAKHRRHGAATAPRSPPGGLSPAGSPGRSEWSEPATDSAPPSTAPTTPARHGADGARADGAAPASRAATGDGASSEPSSHDHSSPRRDDTGTPSVGAAPSSPRSRSGSVDDLLDLLNTPREAGAAHALTRPGPDPAPRPRRAAPPHAAAAWADSSGGRRQAELTRRLAAMEALLRADDTPGHDPLAPPPAVPAAAPAAEADRAGAAAHGSRAAGAGAPGLTPSTTRRAGAALVAGSAGRDDSPSSAGTAALLASPLAPHEGSGRGAGVRSVVRRLADDLDSDSCGSAGEEEGVSASASRSEPPKAGLLWDGVLGAWWDPVADVWVDP